MTVGASEFVSAGAAEQLRLEIAGLDTQISRKAIEVLDQWHKFDAAHDAGLFGAPLVQIDRKLRRLEREQEDLELRHAELIDRLVRIPPRT